MENWTQTLGAGPLLGIALGAIALAAACAAEPAATGAALRPCERQSSAFSPRPMNCQRSGPALRSGRRCTRRDLA